jgi:hypothetical protein
LNPQGVLEGQVRPGHGADREVLLLHIAHHGIIKGMPKTRDDPPSTFSPNPSATDPP